jgi:hypothetical protein
MGKAADRGLRLYAVGVAALITATAIWILPREFSNTYGCTAAGGGAGLGECHRRGHHGRGGCLAADVRQLLFQQVRGDLRHRHGPRPRIGATLLGLPAGEPLWETISNAMLAHYESAGQAPDGEWMARLKLVLAAPAIRGEYLKINSEMQEPLAEAIATRGVQGRLTAGHRPGGRPDQSSRPAELTSGSPLQGCHDPALTVKTTRNCPV